MAMNPKYRDMLAKEKTVKARNAQVLNCLNKT